MARSLDELIAVLVEQDNKQIIYVPILVFIRWGISFLGAWRFGQLTPGVWYTLTVEADYNQNLFTLTGGGLQIESDLAAYTIAQEDKSFTNEAFGVTVESENRWNNCGTAGVFDNQVHY